LRRVRGPYCCNCYCLPIIRTIDRERFQTDPMRSNAFEIAKSRRDYSQASRTSTLSLARIDIDIDTGWRIKLFDIGMRFRLISTKTLVLSMPRICSNYLPVNVTALITIKIIRATECTAGTTLRSLWHRKIYLIAN